MVSHSEIVFILRSIRLTRYLSGELSIVFSMFKFDLTVVINPTAAGLMVS